MIESFKLPVITPETLTGSIVSFNDEYGGLPLKSCTSLISGYQEGSGVPSPVNKRPLHAFSSATLTDNSNTHLFTFGTDIYSGSIDWKRGIITGIQGIADLGDFNWNYSNPSIGFVYTTTPLSDFNIKFRGDVACTRYLGVKTGTSAINDGEITVANSEANPIIFLKDSVNLINLTTTEIKEYLTGIMLAYELATPIEIPLGGVNLLTRQGVNNIFCDTGDTTLEWLKVN